MIKNNSIHMIAAAFSLICAGTVSQGTGGQALLGWGVALANYMAGFAIKRAGFRSESDVQRFSIFSVIRLLTFLGVVFIILMFLRQGQVSFAYGLLTSYMIFMIADLVWIWQSQRIS